MLLFAVLGVLSMWRTGAGFENLCPSVEDLHPCGCVSDGINIRVDCIQVSDVTEVRRALQSTMGIRNVFVDFLRARIPKIPSDLFQGLHVTQASFTNCELQQFGDEGRSALEGLEHTIQEFSIHFSFPDGNELKFLNLSNLHSLEYFWLEGNDMTKMGDDWFQSGPFKIRNLYVMTNFIRELGDRVFAPLAELRSLWLTGNMFKNIKRSMLPNPALHLNSLDLTNNEISHLPEDMFNNMPSLKEVILAENNIQRLPQTTWASIWPQLTRLYLESNPLECDPLMEWTFKVSRPYVVKGTCVGPGDNKGRDIKTLIDESRDDQMEE